MSSKPVVWRICVNLKKWDYSKFLAAWTADSSTPILQSCGAARMRAVPAAGDSFVIHTMKNGRAIRLMAGTVVQGFMPTDNSTDPFNTKTAAPHRDTPLAATLRVNTCFPLDAAPAVAWRGQRTWQLARADD